MKKSIIVLFLLASQICQAAPDGYLAFDGSDYVSLETTNSSSSGDVILLDGLDYPALYWVWPYGVDGTETNYGKAFPVNRAESMFLAPWWREPGERFSIFGTAMSLTNTVATKAWCVEEAEWITAIESDFYRAQFIVPDDWTTGDKTLYIHNGFGAEYGLDPNPVSVLVTNYVPVYNGPTNTVGGTDWTSITTAFAQLSPGETLYFPEGTYLFASDFNLHSTYNLNHDIRITGDGPDKTIFMPATNYAGTLNHKYFFDGESEYGTKKMNAYNLTIDGIRFDAGDASRGLNGFMHLNGWNNVISNCAFTVSNFVMTVGAAANFDYRTVGMNGFDGDDYGSLHRFAPNFFVSNTVEVLNRTILGRASWVEGNTFICYSADRTGGAISAEHGGNTRVTVGNTFLQADPDSSNVLLGGGGRVTTHLNNYYATFNEYYADNVAVGFGPSSSKSDQNSGEMILWEGVISVFRGSPVSATVSNMTINDLNLTNPEYVYTVVYSTGECIETNQISSISGTYSNTINIVGSWATTPVNNTHYIRVPSRMAGDRAFGTVTSNALTFTTMRLNKQPTYMVATIESGTGKGQTRRIIGYDQTTGTCAVYPNWNIIPDSTSTINISTSPINTIIHNNTFEGSRNWLNGTTAGCLASLYGGSAYCYIDGNTLSNNQSAVVILSYPYRYSGTDNFSVSSISSFDVVRNNRFENLRDGMGSRVANSTGILADQSSIYGIAVTGNLVRNSWLYGGYVYGLAGTTGTQTVDAVVFSGNTFDNNVSNGIYAGTAVQNMASVGNTAINTYTGTNLIWNGTFDDGLYWNKRTGVTVGGGTLNLATTSYYGAMQTVPSLTYGVNYTIELDISNYVSGTLVVTFGTIGAGGGATIGTGDGHKKVTKTYLSNHGVQQVTIHGSGDFNGSVDNVLIYQTP